MLRIFRQSETAEMRKLGEALIAAADARDKQTAEAKEAIDMLIKGAEQLKQLFI